MHIEVLSKLVIRKINFVSVMYSEAGKKIKRSNRSSWAIVLKYEGETIYKSAGKQYISAPGNAVILPKGSDYETRFVKSGHFYIIEFESDLTHNTILHFTLKNPDRIFESFRKMEYIRNMKGPMCEQECMQIAYSVINTLAKETLRKYVPESKQQMLLPVLDYIAKNYNKKIKNHQLAALTGYSTDHFRKIFFQAFSVSPVEYINEFKTEKAKEMLKSDYTSISDIAFTLGYSNIYDFSRSFKKRTGMSPSDFRNSSSESDAEK